MGCSNLRFCTLQLLEPQLQLLDLLIELLGGAPELHALELRDQQLQVLDLGITYGEPRLMLEHQRFERIDIVGKSCERFCLVVIVVVLGRRHR